MKTGWCLLFFCIAATLSTRISLPGDSARSSRFNDQRAFLDARSLSSRSILADAPPTCNGTLGISIPSPGSQTQSVTFYPSGIFCPVYSIQSNYTLIINILSNNNNTLYLVSSDDYTNFANPPYAFRVQRQSLRIDACAFMRGPLYLFLFPDPSNLSAPTTFNLQAPTIQPVPTSVQTNTTEIEGTASPGMFQIYALAPSPNATQIQITADSDGEIQILASRNSCSTYASKDLFWDGNFASNASKSLSITTQSSNETIYITVYAPATTDFTLHIQRTLVQCTLPSPDSIPYCLDSSGNFPHTTPNVSQMERNINGLYIFDSVASGLIGEPCRTHLIQYFCGTLFSACDASGFALPPCPSDCETINSECSSILLQPIDVSACTSDHCYVYGSGNVRLTCSIISVFMGMLFVIL